VLLHAQIYELPIQEVRRRLSRSVRTGVILEMPLRFPRHIHTIQFVVTNHFVEDDYCYFTGSTCDGRALTVHIPTTDIVTVTICTD
jgi:hypothetical protein